MEFISIETPTILSSAVLMDAVVSEVRKGLMSAQKSLAPWLFYNDAGSALFEEITMLPEYYVSRLERKILRDNARSILRDTFIEPNAPIRIVELGAGSGEKTHSILSEARILSSEVTYVPIDISPAALEEAQKRLERDLPGIRVEPIVSDYVSNPIQLKPFFGTTMALYIGSSIGNFEPLDARKILFNIGDQLTPTDTLLLGTDLVKPEQILIPAYNDVRGVTAEFNRNVLRRLNEELQANFLPEAFVHRAVWNKNLARMEMYLESQERQRVSIPLADLYLEFEAGETIHTENSYKYTSSSVYALLEDTGFSVHNQWKDEDGWYAVTLAGPIRNN
jgi:dimethylhistidine N-methyltransferase